MLKFWKSLSENQVKDAGTAAVLILLVTGYFSENSLFYHISIPLLVVQMTIPAVFYPFAFIWWGLASVMGYLMSRLMLSFVFFIVICPVALIRKLTAKDGMMMKFPGNQHTTAYKDISKEFGKEDLTQPF